MRNEELAQDQISLNPQQASLKNELNRGYYRDGHWGQCLELLQHLCQYSHHLLLVSGQSGIGKTALCSALLELSNQDIQYCALLGSECQDIGKALAAVATGFHLPWPVNAQDEQAKNAWMQQVDKHDQTWVLLIDDATALPQDVFESLLQLAYPDDHQTRFHVVLFGPPEFEKSLSKTEIRGLPQGRLQVIELEPLTLEEVEGFLAQLWKNAGNNTALPFKQSVIKKIFHLSGGVPIDVVRLANAYLKGDKLEGRGQRILQHFFSPLGIGLSLLGGLMLAFIFAVLLMDFENKKEIKEISLPLEEVLLTEPEIVSHDDKLTILKNIATQATNDNSVAVDSSHPVPKEGEQQSISLTELEQAVTHVNQTAKKPEVSLSLGLPTLEEAVRDMNTEQKQQDQAIVATLNIEKKNEVASITEQSDAMAQKTKQLADLRQEKQQDVVMPPLNTANHPSKSKEVKKQSTSKAFSWSENFLLERDRSHVGLQLLATGSEANMQKFIESNNLNGKAFYYKTTRHQKPWFVLIYGDYTNRQAAMAAIEKLPAKVQALKPWPRIYASIHASIKEGR